MWPLTLGVLIVLPVGLILLPVLRRYFLKGPFANIPGPPSSSIITGNFLQLFNADGWGFHQHIASTYGGVTKINALLGEEQLYIYDPIALYAILVQNGQLWTLTERYASANRAFFGPGIVASRGDTHRKHRKLFNPAFAHTNLREFVPMFYNVSQRLRDALLSRVQQSGSKEIDMYTWFTRTALEVIGQTGLGYSFDTLSLDAPEHEFSKSAKELVPAAIPIAFALAYILPWASKIGPRKFQRWVVDTTPWSALHRVRDILDVMYRTSTKIYKQKKLAFEEGRLHQQIGEGKDIISILMKGNMDAGEQDHISEEEIIAQITTIVFAAMDTTSSTLARIFLLLASHPEEQQRLREEISAACHYNDCLDYDALSNLPYLDAIIKETLRLYPPLSQLSRINTEDVLVPLSTPIKGNDGTEITEIYIPKGCTIGISILGANRNTAVWGPDALEWKPERWLADLPKSVTSFPNAGTYSNLLTFMGGPRSCIGFQFALLEIKVVICTLISSFSFKESNKPIKWDMGTIVSPRVESEKDHTLPLIVTSLT